MRHGARMLALSQAGTALPADAWAAASNPALLARQGLTTAVMWSPAPFGLRELSHAAAVVTHDASAFSWSALVQSSGFALYRETEAAFACAMTMGGRMHVGTTIGWRDVAIQGYGSAGVLLVDLGAAMEVSDGWVVATVVGAVNRPTIGRSRERLPITFSLGSSMQVTSHLLLVADAWKDLRHAVQLRFGVEYIPLEQLRLRAGSATEPGRFSAGIGTMIEGIAADYAVVTHSDLGLTHILSVAVAILR